MTLSTLPKMTEILSLETTLIENIIPTEVKDKHYAISFIWGSKNNTNLYIKQKQGHRHIKNRFMVTKGDRDWGGQIMSMELTGTNYYIQNS